MPSRGQSDRHGSQGSEALNKTAKLCRSAEADAGARPAELVSRLHPEAL